MIRVNDLEMTYPGGIKGLCKTSLEFNNGDFTVLLGTSGAGKSTLLRCLNFLNAPTSGTIHVDGIGSISEKKALQQHRKQTAMIFQQHQLIERQSALKNVCAAFLSRYPTVRSLFPLKKEDLNYALQCLERVNLLDKAMTRVDSLSGGQQQRVGIARALAQKPNLILADEPVASLDPETSRKVLSLLFDIAKEDMIPAIVSLHQVELAKEYADRIIGVAGGRVVFDGTPKELNKDILDRVYQDTCPNRTKKSSAVTRPDECFEPVLQN